MAGKYEPLADYLAQVSPDQAVVELTFQQADRLVGGLPASARIHRTWWANNSHGHALAWRDAGWHVDSVEMSAHRVRFIRGRVGGSRADRLSAAPGSTAGRAAGRTDRMSQSPLTGGHNSAMAILDITPAHSDSSRSGAPAAVHQLEPDDEVMVAVRFNWQRLGSLRLDSMGKVEFPRPLPMTPGLYRMTFSGSGRERTRYYIGETDNLRRRLGSNYRNPGPRQQTSLRVNSALRTHLGAGGEVALDVAMSADLGVANGDPEPLDLSKKAGRLLAESAALVLAHRSGHDLENLG